jgi:hypothetical protein
MTAHEFSATEGGKGIQPRRTWRENKIERAPGHVGCGRGGITMIKHPDKLAYTIMCLRFPFLRDVCERHGEWVKDIYQIGFLCFYESGGNNNKEFWNAVQRELYMLSKALGFRRTRKNKWWKREQPFSSCSEKEDILCSSTGQ